MSLKDKFGEILDQSYFELTDILPSDWAEANMEITSGKFTGPLRYDRTPYSREIINCFSPYNSVQEIVLMGGAQWGKSKTIIEPAIAYTIDQCPCNMGYLTGHSDLSDESMAKLDSALDHSGVGAKIKSSSIRQRNRRTGDTAKLKEFPFGSLISGSATNHKLLRQRDWERIFADDIEAARHASKQSGSTVELIRARAQSFGPSKKIFWCSTPEDKYNSIIEDLFLSGDQRRWHIPCPCCGVMIVIKWSIDIPDSQEKAGMVWVEDNGRLKSGSVGYRCQECYEIFDDSNKWEFNLAGMWVPTAVSEDPNLVSFHLPTLYANAGTNSWEDYVRQYLKANPFGQPQNQAKMRTFVNLVLGETFEGSDDAPEGSSIQKNNTRKYEIGTIPERMSVRDGNGRIVLVTCACDLNGLVDDGRLDYEVIAWAENGSNYSLGHGSIGTFIPATIRTKEDEERDRVIWTYEENKPNCIWDEFEKVLQQQFKVDVPDEYVERNMSIMLCGLDTGNTYKSHAYTFIDSANEKGIWVLGIKGAANEQYHYLMGDKTMFKNSKERPDKLYILEVGYYKDNEHSYMKLNWNGNDDQPSNFMNFPEPANGLYAWNNFYSHFESEKRIIQANEKETDTKAIWKKKASNSQNHQWDCRIYNHAIKDIFIEILSKNYKTIKDFNWGHYVKLALQTAMYAKKALSPV